MAAVDESMYPLSLRTLFSPVNAVNSPLRLDVSLEGESHASVEAYLKKRAMMPCQTGKRMILII